MSGFRGFGLLVASAAVACGGRAEGSAGPNGDGGSVAAAGASTAGAAADTAGADTAGADTAGADTAGADTAGADTAGAILLPVDDTGFVSLPTLGIQGAWYGYGDGQGKDGTVAMSDCVLKGMHMPSDCSKIDTPLFGAFPQATPGKMCTSGTVAKVIPGMVGCSAPATTCADFSNLLGAGIGLDLNNAGTEGGTGKMPFNATMAGVIGISFDLDAPRLDRVRVEFPTVGTEDTSAMWKPGKRNLSPLVAGHNVLLFTDVESPTFLKPAIPFDPTKLLSIQFHVPSTTAASAMYSFCISNLAVVTGM